MQPVLWNPFREMDDFFRFMRDAKSPERSVAGSKLVHWAPVVDISEKDAEYLIKGELPGVKREDVDVTVENGVLTLSGERRFEKEDSSEKHHRVERAYGSFSRSFSLPDNVDPEQIRAEYADGVVTVHLPKSAPQAPAVTRIPVN